MSVPVTSAADRDAVKLPPTNALGRQLGLMQAAAGKGNSVLSDDPLNGTCAAMRGCIQHRQML